MNGTKVVSVFGHGLETYAAHYLPVNYNVTAVILSNQITRVEASITIKGKTYTRLFIRLTFTMGYLGRRHCKVSVTFWVVNGTGEPSGAFKVDSDTT